MIKKLLTRTLLKRIPLELIYKEFLTRTIKKATLELINESTSEMREEIKAVKKRHEEDFRYLNDKIDTQISQLRGEIAQLRGELKGEIAALNQRLDTIIQLIMSIKQNDKQ